MIEGGKRPFRRGDRPPSRFELVERLGRRHFVNEVQSDVQLGLTVRQPPNRVLIPHLLKKRLRHA